MFVIEVKDQSILLEGERFWPGTFQVGDFAERFLASTELDSSFYNDLWKRAARALIENGGTAGFPTSVSASYGAGPGCWVGFLTRKEASFIQTLIRPDDLIFNGEVFVPASEEIGQILLAGPPDGASRWVTARMDLVRFAES